MRETSANELLMTHRNSSDDIETREGDCPGMSMAETYSLAMRCPVYRRRESHSGFCTELENLASDGKGKDASGRPARSKVPKRESGADCSVVAMKRGNFRGAKGAGHLVSRSRFKRRAVQKMKEDPSESPCRGRLQTATSCCGQTAVVVNVVVKRRGV